LGQPLSIICLKISLKSTILKIDRSACICLVLPLSGICWRYCSLPARRVAVWYCWATGGWSGQEFPLNGILTGYVQFPPMRVSEHCHWQSLSSGRWSCSGGWLGCCTRTWTLYLPTSLCGTLTTISCGKDTKVMRIAKEYMHLATICSSRFPSTALSGWI